jgi:hypothetical protein
VEVERVPAVQHTAYDLRHTACGARNASMRHQCDINATWPKHAERGERRTQPPREGGGGVPKRRMAALCSCAEFGANVCRVRRRQSLALRIGRTIGTEAVCADLPVWIGPLALKRLRMRADARCACARMHVCASGGGAMGGGPGFSLPRERLRIE